MAAARSPVADPPIDPAAGVDRPYTAEEIAEIVRRGNEIFERDVRPTLPPEPPDDFISIDVNGGGWEIDEDAARASLRLRERRPAACSFQRRLVSPHVGRRR